MDYTNSRLMTMERLEELKQQLSEQWNKPKKINLKINKKKKIVDEREPRDYELIKELQTKIAVEKMHLI